MIKLYDIEGEKYLVHDDQLYRRVAMMGAVPDSETEPEVKLAGRAARKCGNCGKSGHNAKTCPN